MYYEGVSATSTCTAVMPQLPCRPTAAAAAPASGWHLLWEDRFDREHVFGRGSCWEAQLGDGSAYGIPGNARAC